MRVRWGPEKTGRDIAGLAVGWIAIGILIAAAHAAEPAGGAAQAEVTPSLIREIQFMLLRLGNDPGPIDGVVGPQTTKALHQFQERSGLPTTELVNGGKVSAALLGRLRNEASRVIFESGKPPESPPAVAPPPPAPPPAAAAAPVQPAGPPPDRFAACPYNPEDFRVGETQYTPDRYLQVGFGGSTARAVPMLKDRLNEARQIAGAIGGSALSEVQRQSRVLDYFDCRLKIEQKTEK